MPDWVVFLIFGIIAAIPITMAIADKIKELKYIRKANDEWDKTHNVANLKRKKCLDCQYCVWYVHRPLPYSESHKQFRIKYPSYCKKLKRSLPSSIGLRCQAEYHSQAMYEDSAAR